MSLTTSRLSRSSYGLDSGSETNYRVGAPCGTTFPARWWSSENRQEIGMARWVCENVCTLRRHTACRADAQAHLDDIGGSVYAGVLYIRAKAARDGVRPAKHQPRMVQPADTVDGAE